MFKYSLGQHQEGQTMLYIKHKFKVERLTSLTLLDSTKTLQKYPLPNTSYIQDHNKDYGIHYHCKCFPRASNGNTRTTLLGNTCDLGQ